MMKRIGFVIVALLMSILLSGCGSWMVHQTRNPKGGVIGWKSATQAVMYMRNYCEGPFQVISGWDGNQGWGQYMYTAGDTTQVVTLHGGHEYMAFVCTDQSQTENTYKKSVVRRD